MRVALIDYDSGNLHSAEKAFQLMGRDAGADVVVTSDPQVAARADRIVLPGNGAFPACREALGHVDGMAEALREAVKTPMRGRAGSTTSSPCSRWLVGTMLRPRPARSGTPHSGVKTSWRTGTGLKGSGERCVVRGRCDGRCGGCAR